MFNGFKYTKQLEEAGFSRSQAETQLQIISEIVEGDLATKQDLKIIEIATHSVGNKVSSLDTRFDRLEGRFDDLGARLDKMETRFDQLESKFDAMDSKVKGMDGGLRKLEEIVLPLEYRLTIKLGTMLVIGFTTMATLLKFWMAH